MDGHLAEVKLVTDGRSIFKVAKEDNEVLDALREGQLAFFVAIDEITRSVEDDVTRFELDRTTFLQMLHRVEDDVREALVGRAVEVAGEADLVLRARAQRVDVLELLALQPGLKVTDDAFGCGDADIRHDQQGLQLFEHVLVDLAARCEIGEIVRQPAVAAVEAGTKALDESLPRSGLFFLCRHRISKSLAAANHLH